MSARPLTHACCVLALSACSRSRPAPHEATPRVVQQAPSSELRVPLSKGAIEIDGEPEEAAWQGAARTGAFVDALGAQARPFTEARVLRDDTNLYLHLYAADDDLRAPRVGADGPLWLCDRFRLTFRTIDGDRVLTVTPRGELADGVLLTGAREDRTWQSHARVAADVDGTIDSPRDDDEEWAVELAVPLASLPARGGSLPVTIERFDIGGKGSRRAPLRYTTTLRLPP